MATRTSERSGRAAVAPDRRPDSGGRAGHRADHAPGDLGGGSAHPGRLRGVEGRGTVIAPTGSGLRERGSGGLLCLALLCVLWALGPTPAYSADSEQQERIERWNNLEPEEREELRRRYRRLQRASPQERRALSSRLEQFRSLSPAEQKQMRKNHRRWKQFSPERRARMRKNLQRWRQLSPVQQREMKDQFRRWQRLSPEEQGRLRERIGGPPGERSRDQRGRGQRQHR